ncbi:hypothetical protein MT997_28350 [Paenibacillus sp. OVF10]|nr:hypothetical protein MT997_28350 [Paenibacillus sp. OVF10]
MRDIDEVFLNEVEKHKKLLIHEALLIELSKRGYQDAKCKLGKAKQVFLIDVCFNYLGLGIDFMDLINEAGAGLYEGIEHITDYQGDDINEFLKPYIEKAIQRAIDNDPHSVNNQ